MQYEYLYNIVFKVMVNDLDYEISVFSRYLDLLHVERSKPSYDYLAALVKAHLTRVPFENISKLYYRKKSNLRSLPDLDKYLDGIEKYNFGGTCYSNNYYLYLLLRHLGFDIKLCGADMSNPDVHLVSIVSLADREYVIDVGYAAPFIMPMPRDLRTDYEIVLGNDRYVLRPQDSRGRSEVELYRDGHYKHGYIIKPNARAIGEFADVIARSYSHEATFMNALLLVRFYHHRSVVIHNLTLIKSEGAIQERFPLPDRETLTQKIEEYFEIPRDIAREAIADLGELQNAWN